ncbi:MAG: hypothetical protein WCL02_05500 [bacterium]
METAIFIGMACLIISVSSILWKNILHLRKTNKKYKQVKREAAIQQIEWLILKKQLKIICDFLPDPNNKKL